MELKNGTEKWNSFNNICLNQEQAILRKCMGRGQVDDVRQLQRRMPSPILCQDGLSRVWQADVQLDRHSVVATLELEDCIGMNTRDAHALARVLAVNQTITK